MSEREERIGQAEHRKAMLDGSAGRVVELGAGNGINFKHYPAAVAEVVAVEPDPYLRKRAEQAARHASVPVTVVIASPPSSPAALHATGRPPRPGTFLHARMS